MALAPQVNVLLVDDRPPDLLALEAVLAGLGHNLVKARSGAEAVDRAAREDFALILLDVRMPGMDGFETARRLRECERAKYVPIIFITGEDPEDLHRLTGYTAGGVDYLVKPFSPEVLRAKVATFAGLWIQAQEARSRSEEVLRYTLAGARCLLWSAEVEETPQGLHWQKVWLADEEGAERFLPVERRPGETYLGAWRRARHPEDARRAQELGRRAIRADRSYNQEFRVRRADGEWRWLSEQVYVDPLGPGWWRAVGVSVDITERREAEEAQRASNRRLQLLTETATEALRGRDPQEFISAVYQKLATFLGLEVFFHYQVQPEERKLRLAAYGGVSAEIARSIEWLEFGEAVCGRVAHEGARIVAEEIQVGGDPRTDLVRSLGITAYACYPLVAQGQVIGTLSFGTRARPRFAEGDLSVMQAVADQVAAAVERWLLMKEAEQRAATLAEADRRKDEFLAMLGHELRNPLGAISNATEALKHFSTEEERRSQLRAMIDRQVRHLSRIVDDLLDVSRLSHGLVELRKESVDLAGVIAGAVAVCRHPIESRGHQLTVSLPQKPILLEADPARLAQVLCNLLDNAAKFSDPGGQIALFAALEETESGPQAVVRVRDAGIGIPPALLPHVFEPFTQGSQALDRSQGGSGVGLTLVRRLVEMHGGTIQAQSEGSGRGAEFVLRLPAVGQTEPPPRDAGGEGEEPSSNRVRVLVVEDHPDAAQTLGDLLAVHGYEVRLAQDGPSAVRAGRKFHPHAVLLDIGLPGMDGCEVARALRNQPRWKPAMIIAVTGYGQEEDRRRSQAAGIEHHLVKPVDLHALLALLTRLKPEQVGSS
jgi:signal transduction histidine kinase/DNA-binding NarL/FixJ family response regulator